VLCASDVLLPLVTSLVGLRGWSVQGLHLTKKCAARSKRYGFDATSETERRRLVLSMAPVDWAAEWLRPVPPNFKMVGPVLAEPGKPLPADIEVHCGVAYPFYTIIASHDRSSPPPKVVGPVLAEAGLPVPNEVCTVRHHVI
jgi:hypothetical protein